MYQIGAVLYFIWGLLHLVAAMDVFKLSSGQNKGMVQGRLFQHAWNLAIIAIAAMVIAVVFNWQNSLLGYWINLITVSITDIGFVLFILVPGYIPLKRGILGPILWILAAIFSTLAIL